LGERVSPVDGGTGTGVGTVVGAPGRAFGNSGSVPLPQPIQMAAPSTVVEHPAADARATSSPATTIQVLVPVDFRTRSEY
jgi:hypothetical protein